MRIRLDDPLLVEALVQHLRRAGCVATAAGAQANGNGATVDVQLPGALDDDQARLELELYLKVFQATHPGARAVVS